MGLRIAIALTAAAAIAYEVLLIRIFSIIQWHHFAAMVISLALLGYGASGSLLAWLRQTPAVDGDRRWRLLFVCTTTGFGLSILLATAIGQRLEFNPLAIVWDPRQSWLLAALFVVLSGPFLLAATSIGLALTFAAHRIPSLYAADLVGAGCGSLGVLATMFWMGPAGNLRVIAAVAVSAASLAAAGWRVVPGSRRLWLIPAFAWLALFAWPQDWSRLLMSEYKPLQRTLLVPGASVVSERSSPLGLLSAVTSPQVPFRYAPGLSLDFAGRLPDQLGLFLDGDSLSVLDLVAEGPNALDYLDYLPSTLPFEFLNRPSTLVLGAAGTAAIASAVRHSASDVLVVEVDRRRVELLATMAAEQGSRALASESVRFRIAEARSFLQGSSERFDLIILPLTESMAGAFSGGGGLAANHLLTVEGFVELLATLEADGILAVSQWLRTPPRESLRLFATAAAGLQRSGAADPGSHLVQIRGWGTVTTLIRQSGWSDDEIAGIVDFCVRRSFDTSYYPGMTRTAANRFHELKEPYLFNGNRAILKDPESFFRKYKFNVRPATDERPFFSDTFRWRSLPELLTLAGRVGVAQVEWGYLLLVVTLLVATLGAVVLILLPLLWVGRGQSARGGWRLPAYFALLGCGFMLVEIGVLQKLSFYLGNPLVTVAVVLAGFLVWAGLGSWYTRSSRSSRRRGRSAAAGAAIAVSLVGAGFLGLLPITLPATLAWPMAARAGVALLLLAPLGFAMGMPFPLGLSEAAERRLVWVPWAWGVNGSMSVVGAAAAPLLAVHLGLTAVVVLGLGTYLLAAALAWRFEVFACQRRPAEE